MLLLSAKSPSASVVSDPVSVNTDSETIGETSDETVSVDVSVDSISETISETSAPATQVLGTVRDRRAIAEYIVESLYNNVLNRATSATEFEHAVASMGL